jgi:hypothetical protein
MNPPHVYFGSNAQAPLHLLSNFNAARLVLGLESVSPALATLCPSIGEWITKGGGALVFPSSEHLWQALKAKSCEIFLEFTVGGRFARVDVLLDIYGEKGLQKWRWWMRNSNVGIAAKLAANPKHKVRLNLVGKMAYERESLSLQLEQTVWMTILRLKFATNQPHREALLATGDALLIEFDRGAARKGTKLAHWGGIWDIQRGCVIGENVMGQYMMAIRAIFRGAQIIRDAHVYEVSGCCCLGKLVRHDERRRVSVYSENGEVIDYWSDIEDFLEDKAKKKVVE